MADSRRSWWPDRSEEDLDEAPQRTMTINEDERDPWSGLLDQHGRRIARTQQPFGFRRTP